MLLQFRLFAVAVAFAVAYAAASRAVLAQSALVTEQLEVIRAKYGLPALAAAVVKGGEIVDQAAVGTRLLGSDSPVGVNDRFHLGSDTKAMTATLAGMMIDEGRLNWTSTIGDVLGPEMPGLNSAFSAITLEQLLSHSSGIPSDNEEMVKFYISGDAFDYTLTDYRKRIIAEWGRTHQPEVPAGSPFQYANFGYVIVGAMIEKASGKPWEELITKRIFEVLGLASAGLGPQATFGKFDAPIGHRVDDNGRVTPIAWGPAADVPAVMGPAGIAHMSILDFARWAGWNAAEGLRGPELVKPETLKRLHRAVVKIPVIGTPKPGTPKPGEYALGWGIVKLDWVPHTVLTHNGSNSLNLAMILVDPVSDIAIVATTNYPGEKADAALLDVVRWLYQR